MHKFLIIQTAFIGDVVLATPVIESLAASFPNATIDFMLRKGNENLLESHPKINKCWIWNKKEKKYRALLALLTAIRKEKYDYVINLQRFASTGFFAAFSKGKTKIGFRKNPFSFLFDVKIDHRFDAGVHEVDRNLDLIRHIANNMSRNPKLYPSQSDFSQVKSSDNKPYICLAPASVWYTKQFPEEKWVELSLLLKESYKIYFLGAPSDAEMCERIVAGAGIDDYENYCGKLSFLQSTALMKHAAMNYVNDSAPMHFASSVNAKTTAIFCSTIPDFGFGPLADDAKIAEVDFELACRPCGIHGKKGCPEGHFDCGYKINIGKYLP
jgi:ADP-heptose:LPS heptosyltransferase